MEIFLYLYVGTWYHKITIRNRHVIDHVIDYVTRVTIRIPLAEDTTGITNHQSLW